MENRTTEIQKTGLSLDELNTTQDLFHHFKSSITEISVDTPTKAYIYDTLDNSLLLQSYSNVEYCKIVKPNLCSENARLILVKTTQVVAGTKRIYDRCELQLIGIKVLDQNYGHLVIRPETFEDKINELFHKTELDFKEFPYFSSNFFFLAEDSVLGNRFATQLRIGLIERKKGILIEVTGNVLMTKYPRIANIQDFESLLELLNTI